MRRSEFLQAGSVLRCRLKSLGGLEAPFMFPAKVFLGFK